MKTSLHQKHPRRIDIPIVLLFSITALFFGLMLPTITLNELVFWKHTFSILSGIQSLWIEDQYFLAVLIFVFSVIFPIIKSILLFILWYMPLSVVDRGRISSLLSAFGKWSMLDVFVVAMTIVITQASGLVNAKAHIGIYLFCASVFLSMMVTMQIERFNSHAHSSPPPSA